MGTPCAEASQIIDPSDGASRTMRPRCCGDISLRHDEAFSRPLRPELCMSLAPRNREAQGRPGACRPHGPPAEKNAGGRYHRFGADIPALPARWFSRLFRVLPGAPGFLVTVRDDTLSARRRGGIGFGMPGPRDLAVRRGAFVGTLSGHVMPSACCAPPASTASHLHVRDDRDTPSRRGGMALHNHVFRKNETGIFFAAGLDKDHHVAPPAEIALRAHAMIGSWQRRNRRSRTRHRARRANQAAAGLSVPGARRASAGDRPCRWR
jgi:hypothetical protein